MTPRPLVLALVLVLGAAGCLAFQTAPMQGPRDARYATVNGVRLRYVDVGKGPAVLLLHGFASALDAWNGIIPALSARHRVLAVDLKGFGWSERPPGDYSLRAQAALVRAFLDQRGVDRVAVVAHSWGSSVALALALAAPERIRRIALYSAYVYDEQIPVFFRWARARGLGEALFAAFYRERTDEKIAQAFFDKRRVTEAFVEQVEAALARPGTRAAALAAVRGLDLAAMQPRYRTLRMPFLLLWGREDAVTPVAVGEKLSAELPDARLRIYPRCGHFPMIEAHGASTAELVRFLGEDLAAARGAGAAR